MPELTLPQIAARSDLLEIGRRAIEDQLIEWRDMRLSQPLRANGLVVSEKDGTPSDVIRFGPEHALKIGIKAISEHLESSKQDAEAKR